MTHSDNPNPNRHLVVGCSGRGTILFDPSSTRCAIELRGRFLRSPKYFILRCINLFSSVRLVKMNVEDLNGVKHRVKFICFDVDERKFDKHRSCCRFNLTPFTNDLYDQLKTIYWPSFRQTMNSTVINARYLPEFQFVNVMFLPPNTLEQISSLEDFAEVLKSVGIGETAPDPLGAFL